MRTDARGLEVTTDSPRAIEAIDHFAIELLSLGKNTSAVMAAAEADPDCAMLQAYAAGMYVYARSPAESLNARPFLDRARSRTAELNDRERIFIDAVDAGCECNFDLALDLYDEIVRRWPTDVVAAKLAELHFLETGEPARQLHFMESVAAANTDLGNVQSMYAFALELNGHRRDAERIANNVLDRNPLAMWAQHCLAHVYSLDYRTAEGTAAMEAWAPVWSGFGRYIYAHNWFHLGSLYLAEMRHDKALKAVHDHVWGVTPERVVEETDTILLLWYLELAGRPLENEWKLVAPYLTDKVLEHVYPFLNAIHIFTLARAGKTDEARHAVFELDRFANSIGDAHSLSSARQLRPQSRRLGLDLAAVGRRWHDIGLPEIKAVLAFAEGDWARCVELLGPILTQIYAAGGSDEQRGVFSQSYLLSLIRSGQRRSAEALLKTWIGSRPPTPLEQHWLSQL